MTHLKQLAKFLITSLVENPHDATVSVEENDDEIMVAVSVNETDLGRVIGREGRTINAVRSVVKIPAIRAKKKLSLRLVE